MLFACSFAPVIGGGTVDGPLLYDVRQFVCQQRIARRRAGTIFAGREGDIAAESESARTQLVGEARAGGIGVDAHRRKVHPERVFHARPDAAFHGTATGELGTDAGRVSRGRLSAIAGLERDMFRRCVLR
ncbi:MAG: hypothetical protein ABSE42_07385 [Bryobacteraceae bacterium]